MKARGFSLIEVMVAMAVLAVGVAATLPMLKISIDRGTEARKQTTAQQLATEVLERLRTEIRFDAMAESNPAYVAADAWKFDVLPHEVAPAAPSATAACQPATLNDGFTYDYGPFPFQREGQTYLVCYELNVAGIQDARGNNRIGIPINSAEARIRVLWRGADGRWVSWSISDILHAGAAT
ncbi:prepilin-type N-terminal cleavage/methylation domain-containing protein [Vulgatibacter sp.]|uniref:type IV pilus modification PilV family protein n=1 Tax=Vulgatibacter sp. TaxID=1971226 RepID=UPI003564D2D5